MPTTVRRQMRAVARVLLLAVVAATVAGCVVNARAGSGRVVTQDVEVPQFRRIEAASGFAVTLRQGEATKVTVSVDDNLLDALDVGVASDTLQIRLRPGVAVGRATLRAEVTVPTGAAGATPLEAFRVTGAARVEADDPLQTSELTLEVDGASTFVAELDVTSLALDASGASRVRLDGDADDATLQVSGATAVDASDLLTSALVAQVSGGSSVQVLANSTADLEASGASRIRWSGDATLTRADSSGASSITRVREAG